MEEQRERERESIDIIERERERERACTIHSSISRSCASLSLSSAFAHLLLCPDAAASDRNVEEVLGSRKKVREEANASTDDQPQHVGDKDVPAAEKGGVARGKSSGTSSTQHESTSGDAADQLLQEKRSPNRWRS